MRSEWYGMQRRVQYQLIDGPISKDAKVREPNSQRQGKKQESGVWSLAKIGSSGSGPCRPASLMRIISSVRW